jgi:hypothetical protein
MITLITDGNGVHSVEPNFNIHEIWGRKVPKMLFAWGDRISCAGPEVNETGETCSTHEGKEKFIRSFDGIT